MASLQDRKTLEAFVAGLSRMATLVQQAILLCHTELEQGAQQSLTPLPSHNQKHGSHDNNREKDNTSQEVALLEKELEELDKELQSVRSYGSKLRKVSRALDTEIIKSKDKVNFNKSVIEKLNKKYLSTFSVVENNETEESSSFDPDIRNCQTTSNFNVDLVDDSGKNISSSQNLEPSEHDVIPDFGSDFNVFLGGNNACPDTIPAAVKNPDFCIYTLNPFGHKPEVCDESNQLGLFPSLHPPNRPPWSPSDASPKKEYVFRHPRAKVEQTLSKRKRSDSIDGEMRTNKKISKQERVTRSEFKEACKNILKKKPSKESLSNVSPNKRFRNQDFSDIKELCLVVSPKVDVVKRFKSYKFDPEDYIGLINHVSEATLKQEVDNILKCRNLKILGIHGVGNMFEGRMRESLMHKLHESCPFIEHMILDDSDIILAGDYVDKIVEQDISKNHLKCLEVKNIGVVENEDLEFIIDNSPHLTKVVLEDVYKVLLDLVVPKVTSLTTSWITPENLSYLTSIAKTSSIRELCIKNVNFDMDISKIEALAESLPQLTSLEISSNLQNIVTLSKFKSLTEIVWDAEVIEVAHDPYFPVNLKYAVEKANLSPTEMEQEIAKREESRDSDSEDQNKPVEVNRDNDEDFPEAPDPIEEVNAAEEKQKEENINALNTFLKQCGSKLTKFSLNVRNKYKNSMFSHLKKSCPQLRSLEITTPVDDQFFDHKHFSIPSLESLILNGVVMTDLKLFDLLEHCPHLLNLEIELAKRLTTFSVLLIQTYAQHFVKAACSTSSSSDKIPSMAGPSSEITHTVNRTEPSSLEGAITKSPRKRLIAKITTEGKEEIHIRQARTNCFIDYLQKKVAILNSKLQKHYLSSTSTLSKASQYC